MIEAAVLALAIAVPVLAVSLVILGVRYASLSKEYTATEGARLRLDVEAVGLRGTVAELEHSLAAHKSALLDATARAERAEAAHVDHLDGDDLRDAFDRVLANAHRDDPGPGAPAAVSDHPTARLRGAVGAMEVLP